MSSGGKFTCFPSANFMPVKLLDTARHVTLMLQAMSRRHGLEGRIGGPSLSQTHNVVQT